MFYLFPKVIIVWRPHKMLAFMKNCFDLIIWTALKASKNLTVDDSAFSWAWVSLMASPRLKFL